MRVIGILVAGVALSMLAGCAYHERGYAYSSGYGYSPGYAHSPGYAYGPSYGYSSGYAYAPAYSYRVYDRSPRGYYVHDRDSHARSGYHGDYHRSDGDHRGDRRQVQSGDRLQRGMRGYVRTSSNRRETATSHQDRNRSGDRGRGTRNDRNRSGEHRRNDRSDRD